MMMIVTLCRSIGMVEQKEGEEISDDSDEGYNDDNTNAPTAKHLPINTTAMFTVTTITTTTTPTSISQADVSQTDSSTADISLLLTLTPLKETLKATTTSLSTLSDIEAPVFEVTRFKDTSTTEPKSTQTLLDIIPTR